jgi:DNA-binding beta-propeller fold protein YncE
MKVWSLGAVLLLAALVAGCGGNSTAIGVVVSAAGVTSGATATVVSNGTLQYSATVTGGSATTVSWAICLPAALTTTEPTNCTAPVGPTGCTLPAISGSALSGHGTITQTGLYTAPTTVPSPNKFEVMASSCVSPKSFGILNTQVDSGVRIQLVPATASIAVSEHYQFTATVTGTSDTAVNWSVNSIAGGNATVGYICPNSAASCTTAGEYFAPAIAPGSVTITAISVADTSKTATAAVTVGSATDPTLTSLDPATAAQGSVEQDVYLIGQNFHSTSTVLVAPPGQNPTSVATTFLSSTLLRATIPGALLGTAGPLPIEVQAQNGGLNIPGPVNLNLIPTRPALIASSPDSVSQNTASATVNLTGGFFSPGTTTVQFDNSSVGVSTTVTNSRQLSVGIPAGNLMIPGLYPIVVQNSGVPAGQPATAALNLAVTPTPISIATAPTATIGVGPNPSAIAIDYASALAVVVNTGAGTTNGTVSVLNLGTSPPTIAATITVGKNPTAVAVDDLLSPHVALVVNSGDQTVSTINLLTDQVVGTPLSVAIGPAAGSPAGTAPVPYAIGINPITHRAVVAYQSFNEATILDLSTGTPVVVEQVGGNVTAPLGTGPKPAVSIDPALNWAVIAPGGAGIETTNIVDLGRNPTTGDSGRAPEVIGSIALPATGIGINSETHQAFMADSNSGTFTSFSLLDNTVNTISFTNNGVALNQTGYVAAAADPLENIGIAVNENSPAAAIVNLKNGNVLQNITLAGSALAVAVDPASNQAFVVSPGTPGGNGSVAAVSLGAAISPLQIVESSPGITFTSATAAAVTLTLTGSGFVSGSQVLLDGTPLTPVSVSPNGRQIVVSVPASMVGSARRYAVEVLNPGGAVSNVTGLSVIQPVTVGRSPVGVAVDTDRDLAVVTNSGSGTVSLVALAPSTPVGTNQLPAGTVGLVGQPIPVGSDPLGVAVLPRLGLALVANNGSNNVSLVDVTETNAPLTVSGCAAGGVCSGQMGVAINQDTAAGVVTNSSSSNYVANNASNNVSFVAITAATPTAAASVTVSSVPAVDLDPTAVAIDPVINPVNPALGYAAVTTASQASSVQLLTIPGGALVQRVGGSLLQVPTGVLFDPVNQVFLVANSLMNNVVIIDPSSLNQSTVRVGINPTSLDYNFQASTLVTVNGASHTMSILDYVCPPPASGVTTACPNPQVRAVLGLGGSQQFSVAIDPKLNLAVVADQNNNRILLVPLPF